jgi:hypothetical protein
MTRTGRPLRLRGTEPGSIANDGFGRAVLSADRLLPVGDVATSFAQAIYQWPRRHRRTPTVVTDFDLSLASTLLDQTL